MSALDTIMRPLGRAFRKRRAGLAHSVRTARELDAPMTITLTSTSFEHGADIPGRHSGSGRGENLSPALAWSGVPEATAQLLFVIEDIDVPLPRPIVHTAALLSPKISALAEGALTPGSPAVAFLPTMAGRTGYHGPRPLPGHGPHHYGFHLYALSMRVPADARITSFGQLLPLVAGTVLAQGFLEGVQEG